MHVVVTAGHVDHGKSTLVQALTGRHPDRLEEERRRGLTIELGYCWTDLDPVGEVAFVDVPGHERFIATALSGMGPVPVVMVVVAADDPWMPQTVEHLAALDALGVRHGLVAVTRCDLADPGPMLARAREELGRTSLAAAPVLPVSARTGEGLDLLRRTLGEVVASVPKPDPGSDVRVWVDRRFHVAGAGTVVTGTLPAGLIAVGDELEGHDTRVRVRGLESLQRQRDRVVGPARVAIALGGHAGAGVARGSALVTPGSHRFVTLVDVRLRGSGRLPQQPLLHLGSAQVPVHARPLSPEYARLALREPLPLRIGDVGVLRDPGSRELWGVEVLDPLPPSLARRGAPAARAEALAARERSADAELVARGLVRRSELRQLGVDLGALDPATVSSGEWLLSRPRLAALRAQLRDLVAEHSVLAPPLTSTVVAARLGLPSPDLVGVIVEPPLRLERGAVVGPGSHGLPEHLARALQGVRSLLRDAPFAAPDATQLRELGLDSQGISALQRGGHVLRLRGDVLLLPGADLAAAALLRELPAPFTTSQARQALSTSRRVVLPLLEHLDKAGLTRRLPDDTRVVRESVDA